MDCARRARVRLTLLWLCLCLGCCATDALRAVDAAPSPSVVNGTTKSDWWTEDHPYMYSYKYKRLPNGSIALNEVPESERLTFANLRRYARANRSALHRFFLSKTNRYAAKKVKKFMIMNFVPPMPMGNAAMRAKIGRMQTRMYKTYFMQSILIPGVKLVGSFVAEAIKKRYGSYIKRQAERKRIEAMSLEELCAEIGIPVPVIDSDAYFDALRPTHALSYEPKGTVMVATLRPYIATFAPYPNYTRIYYSPDDDLPAPVLPAPAYPWRWKTQLAETRDAVLQIMALNAQERLVAQPVDSDQSSEIDLQAPVPLYAPARLRNLAVVTRSSSSASASSHANDSVELADDDDDDRTELEAAEEFTSRVNEYHFATGIPRIRKQNYSGAPFPTLASLLREASDAGNSSGSASLDSEAVGFNISSGSDSGSSNETVADALLSDATAPDLLQRKRVLLDAMTQFYAYPSVDPSVVRLPSDDSGFEFHAAGANCSIAAPCLVQSSVTVFTPALPMLGFFYRVVRNNSVSSPQQRQLRVEALQSMVVLAFEAERRALGAGIQAPSTVWYSLCDRGSDEFADALQGVVNATWRSSAKNAADVYKRLMSDPTTSLFHTQSTYHWRTLLDTKRAMETTKAVPVLAALSEHEQSALVFAIAREMQQLDAAITTLRATRAADAEYRDVVQATTEKREYEGAEYSTLGFGFLLPSTNKQNVLFRDLREPEPFHLVLRLFLRFQESRLLLADESMHMLTCLAMLRREISYYRCRQAAPTR